MYKIFPPFSLILEKTMKKIVLSMLVVLTLFATTAHAGRNGVRIDAPLEEVAKVALCRVTNGIAGIRCRERVRAEARACLETRRKDYCLVDKRIESRR
jgi:hypothetical protein